MDQLPPGFEPLELPQLPPRHTVPILPGGMAMGYDYESLRAYGKTCMDAGYLAGLEAAAKVCVDYGIRAFTSVQENTAHECAAAIRDLKGKQ